MKILPLDVIKLISYQLPPLTLVINRKFKTIYDDIWYRDYLNVLYPKCDLWLQTTYRDLYEHSLKMSTIYVCTDVKILEYLKDSVQISEFPMKCVKACLTYYSSVKLMLNFNGDLYRNEALIAKRVIDIDPMGYATKDKWYLIGSEDIREISISGTIIKIGSLWDSYDHYIYVLTYNTLYIYDYMGKQLNSISFTNAKDSISGTAICVLQHNGELYRIHPSHPVKKLKLSDIVKFHGDNCLTQRGGCVNLYGFHEESEDKIINIRNSIVTLNRGGTVSIQYIEDYDSTDYWWDITDIYRYDDDLYLVV